MNDLLSYEICQDDFTIEERLLMHVEMIFVGSRDAFAEKINQRFFRNSRVNLLTVDKRECQRYA